MPHMVWLLMLFLEIFEPTFEPSYMSRDEILALRYVQTKPSTQVCESVKRAGCGRRAYRGCRAGSHWRVPPAYVETVNVTSGIPVVFTRGQLAYRQHVSRVPSEVRACVLRRISRQPQTPMLYDDGSSTTPPDIISTNYRPSLYVINAAALSKPQAVEQLSVDLNSYNVDIAAVTETHLKRKHYDSVVSIAGYTLFRRDRLKRRGGGVAVYARASLQVSLWTFSADDSTYELLWVRIANVFLGVLYHPPRPNYSTESMLNYLEANVDEITNVSPAAEIVLVGDFNQISDCTVIQHTGLNQIVRQPTRGFNILDRIFESSPIYCTVRVIASTVKSDHRAIVAYTSQNQTTPHKIKVQAQ